MPGGIAQMFNPDTGRITYKCKEERAFMEIEAFGGIVKFNQKNAKAIVSGPKTSLENCQVIKPNDSEYAIAKKNSIDALISFKEEQREQISKEIEELKQ